MTWSNGERLYDLLPAMYRVRDAAEGEPLRALLSIIESELEVVEADIEQLYDNWFVETSDEWVVPYIADLMGVRLPYSIESSGSTVSQRAYAANTLRYRRRKGTAAVLEQLARDVSGWPARVVEFFQLLGTSQHINHVRLENVRSPNLRDTNKLDLIGTPFETAARTAEVRHIASGRGRYNIPYVGLYVWRLQSYAVTRSTARAVVEPADGRYRFHPLGLDAPLFNRPQTETDISHLAEETNVPGSLRRRALYDDLEAVRQAIAESRTPRSRYFGRQPVFQVFVDEQFDPDGQPIAVPPTEVLICDLSDWRRPPSEVFYQVVIPHDDGTQTIEQVAMPITVAVDPLLGRITFPVGGEPQQVHISYAYGFSGDVGGGPYNRQESAKSALLPNAALSAPAGVDWQVGVAQSPELTPVGGEQIFGSLVDAVAAWNAQPAGTQGIIAVLDSYTYVEDLTGANTIQMPAGSRLLIVAAEWPKTEIPGSLGLEERKVGLLAATGLRPHLHGNVSVRGTAAGESADTGELSVNGLLVEGNVRVLIGNLGKLRLDHCTLAPGFGGLAVNPSITPGMQNDRLEVTLNRSVVEGVELAALTPVLAITDSVLDRPAGISIAAPGAEVSIDASTVFGQTNVRSLEASTSIFVEPVTVERRQTGCIRFSYVPDGSRTPRRYRCQPDLALTGIVDPNAGAAIRARMTPVFTSTRFGDPGYLQLSEQCAGEIRTGAEDTSEMGVFYHLKQPQRMANLRLAVDEYRPFGLESGIIFVT